MSSDWDRRAPDVSGYDDAWQRLEAAGENPHGEADLVESFGPRTVLDAGCGTGRVTIELARRGIDVVGIDLDPRMLDQARAKAPDLAWQLGDLATVDLGSRFDVVVLAGNVLVFVGAGTEAAVVANLARHLGPGGRIVAGFELRAGGYDTERYDADAATAGLALEERWSTWDRRPWTPGGHYAVSVHRLPGSITP